jgi:glycosyltransferase involved in cell wall biosynthesis
MRVALNGWFLDSPATGTGQYLRHLVAAGVKLSQEDGVELALILPRADAIVTSAFCIARPRLSGNLAKVEFEQITFPRASRIRHFAVAHVPHFGPPLFPSIPTIVTIHDLIPLVLPQYRGSLAVRMYTQLAAIGARRATVVIADSQASRNDILAHLQIRPERVRVIYLAADAGFRPVRDPQEIARVRIKYQLPEQFILYLGGFDVRKNVRVLTEAFSALQKESAAGWKLVIAGRLPHVNTPFFPDPRVGAGTNVQFIGYVAEEDKPALYSSARLLAYPSRYEGFGLPPLEAMACGTPVICAKTGSLPEVVADGGILVNPFDVAAWIQGIRAVLSDNARWSELRARGLAQSNRFSWERAARETLDVYLAVGRQVGRLPI